ncbi:MAG: hypothetical protein ACYT04_88310 [Nostoc sp.]
MAKTLTIQLSDDLESKLTAQAQKLNLSLEDLILLFETAIAINFIGAALHLYSVK